MKRKGNFFVLSGPSGSGKGTVMKEVLPKVPAKFSISVTSRAPRNGEVDGFSYYFKTRKEFEMLIEQDAFLEYTETYGNYYGTLKSEITDAIERGENVILEIDPVGARNVRLCFPDAILIFLVAPSLKILKERLIARGSETPQTLKNRIECAESEINNANLYDYIVINHTIDKAAEDIIAIMKAESLKINKNLELIELIRGGATV